jgi:hypothetical protein
VRHLIDGDKVWFQWDYKTGSPQQPVDLEFILDIDQSVGLIDYRNEGRTDPRTRWTRLKQNTGTRLRYRCRNGALTGAYKIVVWRIKPVSGAPATPLAHYK